MERKNVISLIIFLIFFLSYLLKIYIQAEREKVSSFILGKKQNQKNKRTLIIEQLVRVSTFIWGLVWVTEIFFESYLQKYFRYIMEPKIAQCYDGYIFYEY